MRRRLIRAGWLIVPALLLAAVGWFGTGPDTRVPVHWGLDGQPDRFGGRAEALLVLPALMLGLSAVFAILPSIDPRGRNLQRSAVVWQTAWTGSLILLLLLQAMMVAIATGWLPSQGFPAAPTLTLAAVGAFHVLIGNVLGKARPNWFVGLRTPWTLSSDRAWDKTHRLTGRLMVVAGLIALISVWFVPVDRQLVYILPLLLGPALIGVIYSYWAWRTDPARETATPDTVD